MSIQVPASAAAKPGHYQINGDNLATAFSSTGTDNDVPAEMDVDVIGLTIDVSVQGKTESDNDNTITKASLHANPLEGLNSSDFIAKAESTSESDDQQSVGGDSEPKDTQSQVSDESSDDEKSQTPRMKQACFAAGCFWGTQAFFKKEFGKRNLIHNLRVGYMGGSTDSPKYTEVKKGNTGHAEVLIFDYDPSSVTYAQLCDYFFRFHNPCTKDAQGDDKGTQYRSSIFAYDEDQRAVAEAAINQWNGADAVRHALLQKVHGAGSQVVTAVVNAAGLPFWDAEEYHQAYLEKNPEGECNHRMYIKAKDLPL